MARMPVMRSINVSTHFNYHGSTYRSEDGITPGKDLITKRWNKLNNRHWGKNIYSPSDYQTYDRGHEPHNLSMHTVCKK